jgi:hypothetical protein
VDFAKNLSETLSKSDFFLPGDLYRLPEIVSIPAEPEFPGDVVELADTLDLGSSAARRAGSSPVIPIITEKH